MVLFAMGQSKKTEEIQTCDILLLLSPLLFVTFAGMINICALSFHAA